MTLGVGAVGEGWGENRTVVEFAACGELDEPDSDATQILPEREGSIDPVQPPAAPPYKRAVGLRKRLGGGGK